MADVTTPVLDIDRVLFLDSRNRKFVEKRSPITARARDARDLLWQIAMILAIIGAVLFLAVSTYKVDSGLGKNGKVVKGVIVSKSQFHQTCRVTYQFNGPPLYVRNADLAYQLCPTLAQGQAVDVLYDPQQPLYSNLKVSVDRPKYPVWPVAIGFLALLVIFYAQFQKFQRERSLCAQGQVICGSMLNKQIEMDRLTIQYRFRVPAGFTIQSEGQGRLQRSNFTYDSQYFPDKPNLVAVFFASEAEFYLL